MRRVFLIGFAVLLSGGLGCVRHPGEHQGAQTPAERSRPAETDPDVVTDGPTNPRSSGARPPDKERRGGRDRR
ncbi:MAG: hypothetical protein ACODAU_13810 [Myxococcota bacterium]